MQIARGTDVLTMADCSTSYEIFYLIFVVHKNSQEKKNYKDTSSEIILLLPSCWNFFWFFFIFTKSFFFFYTIFISFWRLQIVAKNDKNIKIITTVLSVFFLQRASMTRRRRFELKLRSAEKWVKSEFKNMRLVFLKTSWRRAAVVSCMMLF